MVMAEIVTEHQLNIAGCVEVDLRILLTHEITEISLMDGTETMAPSELSTELLDVEMVT